STSLRKFADVGLVAPAFTDAEAEEIRDELLKLEGSGSAYVSLNTEADVHRVLQLLYGMQRPFVERRAEYERLMTEGGDPVGQGLTSSGRQVVNNNTEEKLMREFPLLEEQFSEIDFARASHEPTDILWDHFWQDGTFYYRWVKPLLHFGAWIIFYSLLMYTPLVVYTINFLNDSKALPTKFTVTLLGILFSSGNGTVGVMFYYYSETMPFHYGDKFRIAILLFYSFIMLGNMAFSLYLVIGASIKEPGAAEHDAVVKTTQQPAE
ncbi:unnamed protein product, partial [Amoebophrya sp. A25]